MSEQGADAGVPVARPRHRGRRARGALVTLLAGTLVWSSLAFLQTTAVVGTEVNEVAGTGPGGIAEVVPLTGAVSAPRGAAQLQAGVQFARIDVATRFHDDMRVSLAWQNASNFNQQTKTGGWQLRFGIYYPVRTDSCSGASSDALLLTLTGAERFVDVGGDPEVFCVERDLDAGGSGIVTGGEHQGTQLLASDRLVGLLAPKVDQSATRACDGTIGTPCQPIGLDADKRPYFIIGSLLNPGGTVPPGQQASIATLELFVRVVRGSA